MWASASPVQEKTARLALNITFGKRVQDVFSVVQFIQDFTYSRAPVLSLGSGGTARLEL